MNNLLSGFQAGQAIGQGLRGAFSDKPAIKQAMSQVQQGANPQQVYQALAQSNPQAAQQFLQMIQSQQQTQLNDARLSAFESSQQDRQQRQNLIGEIAGDDPVMQLFASDPSTAGALVRSISEMEGRKRIGAGIPLVGALSVNSPEAKRNLIREAASKMESISPELSAAINEISQLPDAQLDVAIAPVVDVLGKIGFIPRDPNDQSKTAQMKNYEFYTQLLEQNPEAAKRFAQAANMNPEERVKLDIERAGGVETAKGTSQRISSMVDTGASQVKVIGGINRALELLDKVSTGGYAAMEKQITDFFGTTPADEAEFAYLTGKTVLGQLKDTFGAQFTNEEAKRLERLEAGLGRSVEANMAILNRARQSAVKAAIRGYRAALRQGDTFTADEIKMQLENAGFDVDGNQLNISPWQPSEPRDIEDEYGLK